MKKLFNILITAPLLVLINSYLAQSSPCTATTTSCTTTVQSMSNSWTSSGSGILDPTACGTTITTNGQYWIKYTPTGNVFNVTLSDATGGGTKPLNDVSFQLFYTFGTCSGFMSYVGCFNNNSGGRDEIKLRLSLKL